MNIENKDGSNRKRCGHTRPKPPIIDLNQLGRLGVGNLLALINCSHSRFYDGMKTGRYPKPDGYDGRMPFWNTGTIKLFLQN